MASLFDQYEQDSQRSSTWKDKNVSAPYAEGEEKPIFQKTKISLDTPAPILYLTICNEQLVLVMSNNVLWRIDLRTQHRLQEVELNRIVPGVKLTGLFLNPSADHLLISFSTELLYLNKKFTKPKPSTKLKGHEITAVAWNTAVDTSSAQPTTKPILLGTSKGIIFEVEISADEGLFSSSIEIYCKQVFDLGKGNPHAITGLQYCRVKKTDTYMVFATTVTRIYKFLGKNSGPDDRPLLQHLFNKYLGLPEGFQEIPSTLDYSKLQLYSPGKTNALGWLTETGIFYAQIDPNNEDQLLSGTRMFYFPSNISPLSFLMTDFHILLLYPNQITVLSSLCEPTSSVQVVFTDVYHEMYGQLLDIIRDPVKGTLWAYSERAVFRYKVNNEDRYVWQIYADKGDYDKAKFYCKDNPINMDKVLIRQAEAYFKNKKFFESALCYADTHASFEEVVLKFLQCQDASKKEIQEALKAFLKEKVKKVRSEDPARTTMLVLWVLELLLTELGEIRTQGFQKKDQYASVQAELDEFITESQTMKCIRSNKRAVYDLMASHGDESNMVRLAQLTDDHKRVVEYFIYKGDYLKALDTLKKEQLSADLWYYFAPDLVDAEPKAMLTAIRTLIRPLDPIQLLPALVAADNSQPEEVIKYLEYCTNDLNCQEQAVHNFFLTLLAQHKPDRLMVYLSIQGDDPSMVNYDIRYGVRVCKEYNRREACVKLSSMLGLWEAAVDLALTVNVQLAINTVSQQSSRKLWLKIAEYVVKEKNDINQAMQFLKQSDLKIEDILPFFPDFTTIDHFKDAICSSLQEYNQHIQDLKEEMEDATKSAEIIRNEIQSFRSKHSVIQMSDICNLCDIQLLLRPFYSFPCDHRFHSDCLLNEVMQLVPEKTKSDLRYLKRQLETGNLSASEREKKAAELDAILASQCLYCGDLMIELIDKPFIPEEDFDKIKKEWE